MKRKIEWEQINYVFSENMSLKITMKMREILSSLYAVLVETWSWIAANRVSVVITCIVIPLIFIAFSYCWNNYICVLKIQPKSKVIPYRKGAFQSEEFDVYLTNNASRPIYSIGVFVKFPKEVNVSVLPTDMNGRKEPLAVFALGLAKVGGNKDLNGADLQIRNMAPKETIRLKVNVSNIDKYAKDFKLNFKVSYKNNVSSSFSSKIKLENGLPPRIWPTNKPPETK